MTSQKIQKIQKENQESYKETRNHIKKKKPGDDLHQSGFFIFAWNKSLFLTVIFRVRLLKSKVKIFLVLCFLALFSACQEKADTRKKVTVFFDKSDSATEMEQRKKYIDTVYEIITKSPNDTISRNIFFNIAVRYYDAGLKEKYLWASRKAYDYSLAAKDTVRMAKALYYIGDYYQEKPQADSAFYYYNKAEKLYRRLKDPENTGRMIQYKARIFYDLGNFTEGEIQGIHALRLLSKTKNTMLVFETQIVVALCLKNLNNYETALSYFDMALLQIDKLERKGSPQHKVLNLRASCYNNIGLTYEKMGNHEKAILLYQKGLATKNLKNERPKLYATLLNNLGFAEMNSGHVANAEKRMVQALEIRDSLQILSGLVSSKLTLGQYYLYKNDSVKAISNTKEAYALARKIKSSPEVIQALKFLTENDRSKEYYANLYFQINDSVQNAERITRDKFTRIAYETDLVKEKNQLLTKRNAYILRISVALLFTALTLFIFFRLRSKNKELLLIQEQQEANEKIYQLMLSQQSATEAARKEERNRIAMELHDGIVNSIFTTRFNLIQLDSGSPDKKQQLVAELQKTENEIRRVSHDLQQNLLFEDKNIAEIITNLIAAQQNDFNTAFDLSIDKFIDWPAVSNDNKIHIYRIIQEVIQNVNKYSKAEKCLVMLLKTGNRITIRIWDNGIGFNTKTAKNGIGLKNIGERIKAMKGELKITSKPGEGTTVQVVF